MQNSYNICNCKKLTNKIRIGYNKFRSQNNSYAWATTYTIKVFHHKILNMLTRQEIFISMVNISMLLPASRLGKKSRVTRYTKVTEKRSLGMKYWFSKQFGNKNNPYITKLSIKNCHRREKKKWISIFKSFTKRTTLRVIWTPHCNQ